MTSSKIRVHVFISGLVQGVFFRHHTRRNANRYSLTGWVKNRTDGKGEAVFEGEEQNIFMMVDWCKIGPPSSRVYDIEIIREEPSHLFTDFSIIYD